MESKGELNQLGILQEFGLVLRQRLDQAQAIIGDLNAEIAKLSREGLLPEVFLVGDAIYQERYASDEETASGQAFVATLSAPDGFGAVTWDSEEVAGSSEDEALMEAEARSRNVLFRNLPPRVQARLLPQVHPLMERLLIEVGAAPARPNL